MKSKLVSLLLIISSFAVFGQEVDYNRIVSPNYTAELSFAEKLVFLAWKNYPINKALQHEYNIAEKNKTKANWAWLKIFSASYNINEYTINPTEETRDRALYYPKYNLSAHLNLEMFSEIPSNIKIAKEQMGIANEAINNQKIALRARVLRTYQNYLLTKEVLEIQTISTEEAFSRFSLSEQRFKNGEITLEQYNDAVAVYNAARRSKLEAESDFNIEKINLEELIGIPLEEVK